MNIILSYPAEHYVAFVFAQLRETVWLLVGSSGDVMGDLYVLFINHLSKNLGSQRRA